MKRKSLYSRAGRRRVSKERAPFSVPPDWVGRAAALPLRARFSAWFAKFASRHERSLPVGAAVLAVLLLFGAWQIFNPAPRPFSQWDIDNAVKYTLSNTEAPPAEAAIAAATVGPSVVRVQGYLSPEHAAEQEKAERAEAKKKGLKLKPLPSGDASTKDDKPDATGSGVVISDKGDILTNLHVIQSTDRWVVTFWDGSKSDAILVNVQPENDLAVIRPKNLPDDLKPAVMASTVGLNPGDTVVAVGFPFGIGPSVSAGVVGGLKREFIDPDRKDGRGLSNLIQFDASANPGNSGGPLVNRDGEVVGIVTAIMNPSGHKVFAGVAFAVPIENAARAAGDNPL